MLARSTSLLALLLSALGPDATSALVLSSHGLNATPLDMDAEPLDVGTAIGIPKGMGYCTQGLLHGWDGRGLDSIADCIKLCSLERDCGFVSYCSPQVPQCAGPKLPGTCSRFARNATCGPLRKLLTHGISAYHTSYEVQPKFQPAAASEAAETTAEPSAAAGEPAAVDKRGFPVDLPVWPSPAPAAPVRVDTSNATEEEEGPTTTKVIHYSPPLAPKPFPPSDYEEEEPVAGRGEAEGDSSEEEGIAHTAPAAPSKEEEENVEERGKADSEEEENVTEDSEEDEAAAAGEEENVTEAPRSAAEEEDDVASGEMQSSDAEAASEVEKALEKKEEDDVASGEMQSSDAEAASEAEKALEKKEHAKNVFNDNHERPLSKAEKKAYEKAKKKKEAEDQKAIENRNKEELKKQKEIAKKEEAWRIQAQKRKEKEEKEKLKEKEKQAKAKAKGSAKGEQGKKKEVKGKDKVKEVAKSTKATKAKDTKAKEVKAKDTYPMGWTPAAETTPMPGWEAQGPQAEEEKPIRQNSQVPQMSEKELIDRQKEDRRREEEEAAEAAFKAMHQR